MRPLTAPRRQQQPFGLVCLCRRKQGQEENRKRCLGGYCCSIRMGKGCMSSPPRWSIPCSQAGARKNQARLVFPLLPSSLLHPLERVCSHREQARADSPLGLLSWLIPPQLCPQLGPGASDLRPSSPKPSSSTKPSPRLGRKRNPLNAVLHLVCFAPCALWVMCSQI